MSDWERRFWRRILIGDGCWEWTGTKRSDGYGCLSVNRRNQPAHRISYELMVGTIPQELQIDHLCRNRICVNPSHLEAVTQRVNLLRGETIPARNAAKTHCPQGHEYDLLNTYISRAGQRLCRACHREKKRAMRAAKSKAVT